MSMDTPTTFKDNSRIPINFDTDNIQYFLDTYPEIEEVWNITDKDSLSIIKPEKPSISFLDWLFSDEW